MKAALSLAPSSCRALAPAVDTYLDGELSPAQVVEVESHMSLCACCRERVTLARALRASAQKVVPLRAPTSLRERVKMSMEAERARKQRERNEALPCSLVCANDSARVVPFRRPGALPQALTRPEAPRGRVVSLAERRRKPLRARYSVPFAVAAGVAFAVSVHSPGAEIAKAPAEAPVSLQNTKLGLDGIVDDLVALHAQPLPPEVTQPDEVRRFDPFVGVPVEPPKLQPFGAKWVGGRMLPLRDSRAAMLQYSLAGGHRISVYVYDPRRVKPESNTLRQRVVRDNPVFVGNVRGYNVAATERQGVGYALATDLGEGESLELVSAAAP